MDRQREKRPTVITSHHPEFAKPNPGSYPARPRMFAADRHVCSRPLGKPESTSCLNSRLRFLLVEAAQGRVSRSSYFQVPANELFDNSDGLRYLPALALGAVLERLLSGG